MNFYLKTPIFLVMCCHEAPGSGCGLVRPADIQTHSPPGIPLLPPEQKQGTLDDRAKGNSYKRCTKELNSYCRLVILTAAWPRPVTACALKTSPGVSGGSLMARRGRGIQS